MEKSEEIDKEATVEYDREGGIEIEFRDAE